MLIKLQVQYQYLKSAAFSGLMLLCQELKKD